jgi:hypothetical protein
MLTLSDCAQQMLSGECKMQAEAQLGLSPAWPASQPTAEGTEASSQQMCVTKTQAGAG